MLRRLFVFICVLFVCAGASGANEEAKAKHVVVEPSGHLTAEDRAELAAAGLTIGKPVPGGRYLAILLPDRARRRMRGSRRSSR